MDCFFKKYKLHFKKPGGTSRGVLYDKVTYFIFLRDNSKTAIGECNRFINLSYDDREGYDEKLMEICQRVPSEQEAVLLNLEAWPSIYFGIEMLLKDWENGGTRQLFPEVITGNGFTIPTNGLIWMGQQEVMKKQVLEKLKLGYTSIKLKIGAIDFKSELALIRFIRRQFSEEEVEIRVDANGGFAISEAKEKIEKLSEYGISYIEQPIKAGHWQEMAALAENTPVKIALDEELIGICYPEQRKKLIETIKPQLLVLKPALIGGFAAANEWKSLIQKMRGSWVITSALESNIGLNAIAQYTAKGWSEYAQGLGTGQLFTNNFPSPYTVDAKGLHYHRDKVWDLSSIL